MKPNRLLLNTAWFWAFWSSSMTLVWADVATTTPTSLDAVVVQIPASTERALHEEMHRMLLRLAESGALGNAPEQLALDIRESAQRSNNLGLLLDSSSATANNGVHVLGVTPGGSAERMGVRSGDVVTAVNANSLQHLGVDTSNHALAPNILKNSVDQLKDGEPLHLDVLRDGKLVTLNAPVQTLYLPAMRLQLGATALLAASVSARPEATASCGRISQFDVAPRQQHLHGAVLMRIDGKLPGPHGQQTFQVATGQHTIEVAEAIENRYLPFNDQIRSANRRYKMLTLDVAANTTYLIAARLNPGKRSDPKAFWDPVMWKQNSETCN